MSDTTDVDMENEIVAKRLTAPRITLKHIEEMMEKVEYHFNVIGTTTYCHAFYDGFSVVTEFTACVDVSNFDAELCKKYAQIKAKKSAQGKLFELEGWRLKMGAL